MYKTSAQLLAAATSSAAPATITDSTLGVAMPISADQALVLVRSTAGSGTMTATLVLWGYSPVTAQWHQIGALNNGSAIAETSKADTIAYAELVSGLRRFTRLYCEITSLGGTNTAVDVYVDCVPVDTTGR